jgi:hypothetical protein
LGYNVPAARGSFDWSICPGQGNGADYRIVLSGLDPCRSAEVSAASNPFTISGSTSPPTLTLTHPNGGQTLTAGSQVQITWTSSNAQGLVLIYLERLGRIVAVIGSAPASTGQFTWNICSNIGNGSGYFVTLALHQCGRELLDFSDTTFSISGSTGSPPPTHLSLISPGVGEELSAGTTASITWSAPTPAGDVRLHLLTQLGDQVASMEMLGAAPMSSEMFNWSIPPCLGRPPGSIYYLFLSTACGTVFDGVNDVPFGIRPLRLPPDLDDDCDVDADDLQIRFLPCLAGAEVPIGPQCATADIDDDEDTDMSDFGILQGCFTGPGVAVNPDCLNASFSDTLAKRVSEAQPNAPIFTPQRGGVLR